MTDWTRHAMQVGITTHCDNLVQIECRCKQWSSPWRESYIDARTDHVEHVERDH